MKALPINALFAEPRSFHFVGIGGAGMSGIAELCLRLGFEVSGCDLRHSVNTARLAEAGARVSIGHSTQHINKGLSAVVFSSAVDLSNPELLAARRLGVPIIPRAEMLGELLHFCRVGIAVAGAHGKTTTTSMVAAILEAAGLDPTVAIGGNLRSNGSNVRLGKGDYMVAEADESDASFLLLSPTIALVTNIDREHLNHYQTMEHLREAFVNFINRVPFYGFAVLGIDSDEVRGLLPRLHKRAVTYGIAREAEYRAENVTITGLNTKFDVLERGRFVGEVVIPLPGLHVALNALGAIALARELKIDFAQAAQALAQFTGVTRRFEIKGEAQGRIVLDDYAHHPAEVRATIAAARAAFADRRLVVIFQPHRYTRLLDLFDEFTLAFDEADLLYLAEVYPAGETPIPGVSSSALYQALLRRGWPPVHFLGEAPDPATTVIEATREGDVIATLGAGDIYKLGETILQKLSDEAHIR